MEEALLRYAAMAESAGLTIVCGAMDVEDKEEGQLVGVCALGAYNRFAKGASLALPAGDAGHLDAWNAIEFGFDGVSYRDAFAQCDHGTLPQAWWALGVRLRKRLRPMPADRLLLELTGVGGGG